MSKNRWVLVTVAAFVMCVVAAVGLLLRQARADADIGSPTAAVMGNTWSVIVGPISEDGDVVGYNVYVFQEKTGMLWAWERGAEDGLVLIPTREERGPLVPGLARGDVR